MIAWVIRKKQSWIRYGLLWLLFPLSFLPMLAIAVGNGRVLQGEFW